MSSQGTGFLIKFANCTIFWSSKQQELTALSTIEAEYIALSSATRHVLFILHLLEDLKALHIDFQLPETKAYAKCFEDNTGCLELAKAPKLRPRTKHIAVKFVGEYPNLPNQDQEWNLTQLQQQREPLVQHP